jgi:hypothetical protein
LVRRAARDPLVSKVDNERLRRAIGCIGRSVALRMRQRRCKQWDRCRCNHCKILRTLETCQDCLTDLLDEREQRDRQEREALAAENFPSLDAAVPQPSPAPEAVIFGNEGDDLEVLNELDNRIRQQFDSSADATTRGDSAAIALTRRDLRRLRTEKPAR